MISSKPTNQHNQQGFTLIELMLAITLGLLLSAAAVQLFITSAQSYRVQTAAGDVQDSAVFGLSYLQERLALANLGTGRPINDTNAWAGIVFTPNETTVGGKSVGGNLRGTNISQVALVSVGGDMSSVTGSGNQWTGISNVKSGGSNLKSDQLVIQYHAPYDMTDCEGNPVLGARVLIKDNPDLSAADQNADTALITADTSLENKPIDGDIVLERYFLRVDANKAAGESDKQALVLACDATHYRTIGQATSVAKDTITVANYGDAGTVMMNRVDQFHVLLGVQTTSGFKYMTIKTYKALTDNPKPPVTSLQVGVLARATESLNDAADGSYALLDQTLTIDDDSKKYIRRVYTTTVQLRNGSTL